VTNLLGAPDDTCAVEWGPLSADARPSSLSSHITLTATFLMRDSFFFNYLVAPYDEEPAHRTLSIDRVPETDVVALHALHPYSKEAAMAAATMFGVTTPPRFVELLPTIAERRATLARAHTMVEAQPSVEWTLADLIALLQQADDEDAEEDEDKDAPIGGSGGHGAGIAMPPADARVMGGSGAPGAVARGTTRSVAAASTTGVPASAVGARVGAGAGAAVDSGSE